MNDAARESLSYFGLYKKMLLARKMVTPESVSFGADRNQYFRYYEPKCLMSDKVIIWVHGGGWNAGSPKFFDFVGQCAVKHGYRLVSVGYRHSPKNKFPSQLADVCAGYQAAVSYLRKKGIDVSKLIVSGPSAGAHLASILCYSKAAQERYGVDVSNIIGFIGAGGPYSFSVETSLSVRLLLSQLFPKGYDIKQAEPCSLICESGIPMLLIQSRHDGLINFACAEEFRSRAQSLGIGCELYEVTDRKDTHSWYTAGMFLETREENRGLDRFFSWIEAL